MNSILKIALQVATAIFIAIPAPQAPTGDDLAIALQHHGMDAATAPAAAVAIEVAIANNNGLLGRVTSLENIFPGPNFAIPACGFYSVIGYLQTATGPSITEPSQDSIVPCDVGWLQVGERIVYMLSPQAGNYTIVSSVASNGAAGKFHFEINGIRLCPASQATCASYTAPNTGGWQTWQDIASPLLALPGGFVAFSIVGDAPGVNFKQFRFVKG